MQSSHTSTGDRILSAILAMGAWSLVLIFWKVAINNPHGLLDLRPFGSVGFVIQMIVLGGIALPWIGIALHLRSTP